MDLMAAIDEYIHREGKERYSFARGVGKYRLITIIVLNPFSDEKQ